MEADPEAVEAVSEILTRVGHQGIAVELPLEPRGGLDHTVKAYLLDDGEVVAKVNDVRDALGHLQAFGLGPIGELVAREIKEEDWLESWKAQFTPLRIGRFLVRPTWSDARAAPGLIEIVLDPGMAFGTGLHPTTQQCVEALSTIALDGKGVLDVGTGSGVLALAADPRPRRAPRARRHAHRGRHQRTIGAADASRIREGGTEDSRGPHPARRLGRARTQAMRAGAANSGGDVASGGMTLARPRGLPQSRRG